MPELKKVYGSYKSQGLVLIGIHSDPDVQKRDALVKEKGLTYPICEDSFNSNKQGITGANYKIDGYPTVFVINRKGKVVAVDPPNLGDAVKGGSEEVASYT